ncbi:MAG: NAD-dependent epimerase/dehydratase family protein [Rhodopirellula sp.]|nr:NAD-dependent epimerase/dehydratase family protein [Rhodopirellula sp.]
MTVLVTGATGLVGNNVVRALVREGGAIRVLVREGCDPRPLDGLPVEIAYGDVRDAESVRRAVQGVESVVHSAAVVEIGWSGLDRHRAVNVEGTRHVAEAASAAGIRLVHVSSVDAIAINPAGKPADEESSREAVYPCPYPITKRAAEDVIQSYVASGLDGVVVNPGFMLGPWDWKPSSGRMLLQVARHFTPLAPGGGCSVCDVRDVADGILAALRRGRRGWNYILAGHNMSYFDLWRLFAEVAGGKAPRFRAGPVLRAIGGLGGDLWGKVAGREPDLNSASAAMSGQFHYYSSGRAVEELDYRIRPVRQIVEEAWQWLRQWHAA